jgi:hypothetical protein
MSAVTGARMMLSDLKSRLTRSKATMGEEERGRIKSPGYSPKRDEKAGSRRTRSGGALVVPERLASFQPATAIAMPPSLIHEVQAAPLWFREKGVPVRNPFTQHVLLYPTWLVQHYVEVRGCEFRLFLFSCVNTS